MLTYDFDNMDEPLYEYIYNRIKEDIILGNLKKGEKLPSKRNFASHHGISTITIQNAYEQLISEGYIYTVPKKGYYVAELNGIEQMQGDHSLSLDIRIPVKKKNWRIDLSDNRMDPENFPFSVWAKISRETISNKSRELMEISPTAGKQELRKAIAEHLRSFRGMLVDPDQIVVGAGTEYLYGLLIQLLGNEKSYCIENPGYKKLAKIYEQYHIRCRYAGMDEKGITLESLRKEEADVIHISPNHHFPTGITMPASRRYEILSWANEKSGRFIIEDDYDSEFRNNGKPLPTLFSIDTRGNVIYMNTFSKSLSPTIRISYMVLPVHLVNRFYEQLSFYACTVSNFEQYTLADFMEQGYFEKHINRMRLYYVRKRKQMIEAIENSRLKEICRIVESDSGLHFLIVLDTKLTDRETVDRLAEAGIRVNALSDYYFDQDDHEHWFIINYSNINTAHAKEDFDEIYQILQEEQKVKG